ncbi:response regulator transcription factor [Pseudomonas peli]|uniref:response regulator transcription factor n=1 Tax=Pseudomonas peli TaxID=592361 RepID=UPI0024AD03E3|nr:response regulator transcription factor [Pseudomonas peli]
MNKVLIVDYHPIMRLSVRHFLGQKGFDVVAEAGNGIDALSFVETFKTDLVVMESHIPLLDGITLIKKIRNIPSPPSIVVFTAEHSYHHGMRCMEAGAHGYVCKIEQSDELLKALKAAQSGYQHFPYRMFAQAEVELECRLIECLPSRELKVLKKLGEGQSDKEITLCMNLSNSVFNACKNRLLAKFEAHTTSELIIIAKRTGLA